MKITIPQLLTFNGGYVDTAGFLALQGLFTAHVTGNFVTLGAALVHGTSGVLAKLLALPLFCIVVVLVRLSSDRLPRMGNSTLKALVIIKLTLFLIAAALAMQFGPFTDGDSFTALITGMTLVAAMAIQNAVHRIHFPKAPPTTLMTGSTTQIMIDLADLADLLRKKLSPEAHAATRERCINLTRSVVIFAVGCAAGALIYAGVHMAVFLLPPVIIALALLPAFHRGEAHASA